MENRTGTILETNLPLKSFMNGKVRDIYDLGDNLLMIATDRISAFDSVLPNGIPYKGAVLTRLSEYWFNYTKNIIGNHMITTNIEEFPTESREYADILKGRSMLVKKTERIDIECVARGYISGSAWAEYKKTGSVCGISLPAGLTESEKIPEPIFTPAIKASSGHDVNISEEKAAELIGWDLTNELKENTLKIYESAAKLAGSKGLILADSKFEFGMLNGELILIDELLTPDSSRFWPIDDYETGRPQKSFDKQFVRDYLSEIKWDKEPPVPKLPEHIVKKTSEKYLEIYKKITGESL